MTQKELLKLVREALATQQALLGNGEATDHPQVRDMVRNARARMDALEAVEAAIRGNPTVLRIWSEAARP